MGSSPLHLWLQSLVKPQRFLGFEREWAVALLQTPASFLPPSAAVSAAPVNYEVNRSLFECKISACLCVAKVADRLRKMPSLGCGSPYRLLEFPRGRGWLQGSPMHCERQ